MSKWFNRGDKILLTAVFIMVLILAYKQSIRVENPTPNSIVIIEGRISNLETRIKNLENRK